MGITPGSLVLWILALLFAKSSIAGITNRTIDDTNGDSITGQEVFYQPDASAREWFKNPCSNCRIQPDLSQTFGGTWTAASYFQETKDPINATMLFNGTAIYVYFILANHVGPTKTSTAANFTVDNQLLATFEHIPDPARNDILYNQLVFSHINMENTMHTLLISVSGIQLELWICFDYAVYTHEDVDLISPNLTTGSQTTSSRQTVGGTSTTSIQPTDSLDASSNPVQKGVSTNPSQSTQSESASSSESSPIVKGPPASRRLTPVGPIVGGISVGVVFIAVLILSLILLRKKRRRMNDLQRVRQQEVEQRLWVTQEEIPGRTKQMQDRLESPAESHSQMTLDELGEMVRDMRAHMESMNQHRGPVGTQGQSDEPPPGYSSISRGPGLN